MIPRRFVSAACLVAAALLLVPALVAGYARHALLDPDQFADRATVALADDDVREVVAREVTDRIVLARASELTAARPLIEAAAAGVVGEPAFQRVFRAGVADAHRAVVGRRESTLTLTVADAGTIVAEALRHAPPSVVRHVGATRPVPLVRHDLDDQAGGIAQLAHQLDALAVGLPLAALAFAALGLGLARDRRRAVIGLGAGASAAGIVVLAGYAAARGLVLARVSGDDDRAAAAAVYRAFFGDLRTWAWLLAGSGAVLAATAVSLRQAGAYASGNALDIGALRRRVRRPLGPAAGAALIGAGVLVIARPGAAVTAVATVGGVVLVYVGAIAILRRIATPAPAGGTAPRPRATGSLPSRRAAAIVVAGLLVSGAAGVALAQSGTSATAMTIDACNGHRELCDRRLDQVVLPATHNSMSAVGPGWYSAEQDAPIGDQLADGIRGLLIDTHYAERLANGRVRTELDAGVANLTGDDVSPAARNAALRMRERLGFKGPGERGVYLCHTLCELGATPVGETLETIRAFLVTHPGEVLVVINEDYVEPRDFVAAVRRAGLERYVWTPSATLPTLGEMVRTDRRLVLLAEHRAGGAPWYRPAYEAVLQETPYAFKHPEELASEASCRPNRGPGDAPLLLVNHWITTDPAPLPANAAKINARAPLLARARDCARVRSRTPNLLAVNFYRRGDLFAVVDALNGVGAGR